MPVSRASPPPCCRHLRAAAKDSATAYWFLNPLTKSSGGNWLAGKLLSPSRSRTVWLYWLLVRRRKPTVVRSRGVLTGRANLLRDTAMPPPASSPLEQHQTVDPRPQRRLLRTARLDALSPGMRYACGRLAQQQRIRGVMDID